MIPLRGKPQTTTPLTMQIKRSEALVARMETALQNPELAPDKRQAAERTLAGARLMLDSRKARQQASKP